tara:strand:+ start:456 stop:2291 length:1836 start_codon:yes stop_codon:yes gene_type:complete
MGVATQQILLGLGGAKEYTISSSSSSLSEGSSLTTTVTTKRVPDGTVLYWEFSGTGLTSGDFSSGSLTGSGTISSNTFNFSHTIASDNTTEGTESVYIRLYDDAGRTNEVAVTNFVILDTSTTPVMNMNGLEHWWEFNETDDQYMEAGNGRRGSIVTAENNWLTIGPSSDLQMGSGNFTIECWVFKYSSNHKGVFHITSNTDGLGTSSLGSTIAVGYQVNRWQLYGTTANGNGYIEGPSPPNDGAPAGNWTHLALVRNGGSLKLFVNGYEEISTTTSSNFQGNYLAIGGYYNTSYLMNGRITNFKITKGEALYTTAFIGRTPNFPVTKSSCGSDPSNVVLIGCRDDSNFLNFEVTPTGASITSQTNGGAPVNAGGNETDGFTDGTKGYAVDLAPDNGNGFCGLSSWGSTMNLSGNAGRKVVFKNGNDFFKFTSNVRYGYSNRSKNFTFFCAFHSYTNPSNWWMTATNNDGNNFLGCQNTGTYTNYRLDDNQDTKANYDHTSQIVSSGGTGPFGSAYVMYFTVDQTGKLRVYHEVGNFTGTMQEITGGTYDLNTSWASGSNWVEFNYLFRYQGSSLNQTCNMVFAGFYNRCLSESEIQDNYQYHLLREPTHL